MHRLRLLADGAPEGRHERFERLGLEVETRSGLHPAEAALLERLEHLGQPRRILAVGSRTGAAGLAAARRWPDARVTLHTLDSHHARVLCRNLAQNGPADRVAVALEPFLPGAADGAEPFDAGLLQLGHGDEPGELALDWIQALQLALRPGARVLVAAEKAAPWLLRAVREAFHAGPGPVRRGVSLVAGTRRDPPEKIKNHAATATLTLPGCDRALRLTTLPGVFAHRRVDEGALALAETIACGPGDRVLDMGCGGGAVGLALAALRGAGPVAFLDGNARAVWCARRNAEDNGVAGCEFLLDDAGLPGPPRFTVFAGNPPYYSQHRIDELFLQTARATLLPGGAAWLVAKNTDWLLPRAGELFGNAALLHRRGYGIVRAELPRGVGGPIRPAPPAP